MAVRWRQIDARQTESLLMKEIKGHRLYVNLSASQVRRRLKGVGFGVRKVETAGKNQAVIIHTASGQHLRELEALFVDVRAPASPDTSSPADEQDDATNS
jgi:hypothetical protein